LRALQHLDVLDIIDRGAKPLRAAQIDAVDIDPHALVAGGLVAVGQDADAANVHDQRGIARIEGRHLERGNGPVAKIQQRGDMAVDDVLTAQHRNGDGGGLQALRALFSGDDDVLQGLDFGGRRRRFLLGLTGDHRRRRHQRT
jgi:hypothetical protein